MGFENIPAMFGSVYVGAPQSVLAEMYEYGTSFEDAMGEYNDDLASGYLGESDDFVALTYDALIGYDSDAIEKAMYQIEVGNVSSGGMTPFGPALSQEAIDVIEDEYPGVSAGRDPRWSDEELAQWLDEAGTLFESEELDTLYDSIYAKAAAEGNLDILSDYYDGIIDQVATWQRGKPLLSQYDVGFGRGRKPDPGRDREGLAQPGGKPAGFSLESEDTDPSTPGIQLPTGDESLAELKEIFGDISNVLTNIDSDALNNLSVYFSEDDMSDIDYNLEDDMSLGMPVDTVEEDGGRPFFPGDKERFAQKALEEAGLLESAYPMSGAIQLGSDETKEQILLNPNLTIEQKEQLLTKYDSPTEVIINDIVGSGMWDGSLEEFLQIAQGIVATGQYPDFVLSGLLTSPQFYDLQDEYDTEGTWDDEVEKFLETSKDIDWTKTAQSVGEFLSVDEKSAQDYLDASITDIVGETRTFGSGNGPLNGKVGLSDGTTGYFSGTQEEFNALMVASDEIVSFDADIPSGQPATTTDVTGKDATGTDVTGTGVTGTDVTGTDETGTGVTGTINVQDALTAATSGTTSKSQNTEDLRKVFYRKMYALPGGSDVNRTYQYPGLLADTKSLFFLYADPSLTTLYQKVAGDTATEEDLSKIESSYDTFLNQYLQNPEAYRTGAQLDSRIADLNRYFSLSREEQIKDPNTLLFDSFYGDDDLGRSNRSRLWSMSVTKGQRGYYSSKILDSVNKMAQYYRNTGRTEEDIFKRITSIGRPPAVSTTAPTEVLPNGEDPLDTGIEDFMGYED